LLAVRCSMENPLSVRANAFAIASIMSDPEAAEYAYGYCAGASQHQHPVTSSVSAAAQCRMSATATSGGDCQYQNDWNLHQHQQHSHQHHQSDVNGYSGGLKAMEGSLYCMIIIIRLVVAFIINNPLDQISQTRSIQSIEKERVRQILSA